VRVDVLAASDMAYCPRVQIDLTQIADESLLKQVWKKEVRPALRSMTLNNFNLASDPLHYAGYEWGITTLVSALSKDLRLGRYSPERGEIVRMAKSKGLSRPLCFLATRDALVYRTITWLIRGQLISQAKPWVGVDHADKGNVTRSDEADSDSLDWFRYWLARQGHILNMVDDPGVHYFVESDISNFYPSIRLEAIREHLHSQTSLEKEAVRLCVQIIDGVMPRRDYSEVSLMGLPQEQIGSSREIAHSLLLHVDQEFDGEGEEGRYTRYMDDILIGVVTPRDGEQCIARLQRSLESIGLYPNAAKTTVTSVEDYLEDSMADVNGEVDRLTAELEKYTRGTPLVTTPPGDIELEIVELAKVHRELETKPKRWGRVARRIYTLLRKIGREDWWPYWVDDIEFDPGAASAILEYVRSWPANEPKILQLVKISRNYGELYPNMSILAAETLSSMPIANDPELWKFTHEHSADEFMRLVQLSKSAPESERLAAAWLMPAWKYGESEQRHALLARFPSFLDGSSPVRVQALPLLVAEGESLSDWVAAKPGLAWENALAAEYLRSLQEGEERAVGVAISLVSPQLRLAPQRFTVLPRAMPLAYVLRNTPAWGKLQKALPKMMSDLRRNSSRLRDHRLEHMLASL
jgi:hypothetical protein